MMSFLQQTEVVSAIVGAIVGGIIGIIGSVATFAISAIFRSKGKLIIFKNESKTTFHKRDSMGGYVDTLEMKEAEDIEISIDFDVYNQSDIPKTLGDFKIELSNKKSKIYFPVKVYKRTKSNIPFAETVPTQTIFPKLSANIGCKAYLHQPDFLSFDSIIDIYIMANFPDSKKFRVKVLEMNRMCVMSVLNSC